jgi:O-antigen ligase
MTARVINGLPRRRPKLPVQTGAGGPGPIIGSELRARASPPLVGLSFLLLAVGVWRHHGPVTAVFLVFAIGGYVALGYPGLLTVGIVTIAMGSSSVALLLHSGLFLRWEALALLAVTPLLDGTRLRPFPAGITPVAATLASWCIVSTAWSIAPVTTFERGATFAAVLWVGLVVAPAELSNAQQRRVALLSLLAAGVAGCVAALLLGIVDPSVGRPYGPLRGWLQNSNTVGLWAAALAPTIAVVSGRLRLLAGAAFLAVVVWSQSRTALIVLLVYAITSAVQHPEWLRVARRRAVQLTIASFIVLVVGLLAADPGGIVEHTALGKFRRTSSLIVNLTGTRSRAWSGTISHLSGAPIQGLGFGTVEVEFQRLGIHFNSKNSSDSYLQMLFETGLIGACLFLGLILMLLAGALSALRDPKRAPFALMGIGMIVAALVESILASAGGPLAVIAWTGLGVAVAGQTQPIGLWLTRSAEALRPVRFGRRRPAGSKPRPGA